MDQTVALSPGGDVQIPKEFRDVDGIKDSDQFRFHRIARGHYLLEKVDPEIRPQATLVRAENGLLVFRAPPGAPIITTDLVKKLEAETW
jgi:bifunctional DNA-binding transcriptional regulator/antitoxin component of YhaV-PrlF toxin-antitoxin module